MDRLAIHEDEKLPRSKAQLSKIENGKSPYSQRVIEALAEIYSCEPWELLAKDPNKEGEVAPLFSRLDDAQRERARAYIAGMVESREAS